MKRRSLWFTLLPAFLGYGLLPFLFPLIPQYRIELADVRYFRPSLIDGLLYILLVSVLFAAAWWTARWLQFGRIETNLSSLLSAALLCGLPLLLVYPINANDIFRYILRGRVTAIHNGNPYTDPPTTFDDPGLYLAGEWADFTSPYGPIWELIDAAVILLSGNNLLAALIAHKLLSLLFLVAGGAVIWHLVEGSSAEKNARAALWLFNPASHFMFVIDAHNDVLMLLLLLLGVHFFRNRHQPLIATNLMLLAALTKLPALVPIPFFALEAMRHMQTWRDRIRYILLTTITAAVITFAAFLPFGGFRPLLERLLQESSADGGFSPLVFVYFLERQTGWYDVNVFRIAERTPFVVIAVAAILLVLTLFGRKPERGSAETWLTYILTALKFRIWYILWLFPFALIDPNRRRLQITWWLLITSQISVILYGHFRVHLFNGSNQTAHLIGIPFVFLLPLLIGFISPPKNPS